MVKQSAIAVSAIRWTIRNTWDIANIHQSENEILFKNCRQKAGIKLDFRNPV